MRLDKAIKLGKEAEKNLRSREFPDHADAILLLIEAGKRCDIQKQFPSHMAGKLLPGETEE